MGMLTSKNPVFLFYSTAPCVYVYLHICCDTLMINARQISKAARIMCL